jgi:GDPmannose 4,6-dehydratase
MLQQDQPDDYVVATGKTHHVKDLVELAFSYAGLDWQKYVKIDPRFIRPAEVDLLVGEPKKAIETLGWTPEVDFEGLIHMMVDADIQRLSRETRVAASDAAAAALSITP